MQLFSLESPGDYFGPVPIRRRRRTRTSRSLFSKRGLSFLASKPRNRRCARLSFSWHPVTGKESVRANILVSIEKSNDFKVAVQQEFRNKMSNTVFDMLLLIFQFNNYFAFLVIRCYQYLVFQEYSDREIEVDEHIVNAERDMQVEIVENDITSIFDF